MNAEHLFDAIGYVGADLVDSASHTVPAVKPWRRWLAAAAVMTLVIGVALPRFTTRIQPEPEKPDSAAEQLHTSVVLDGKIYYVDDPGEEIPTQSHLRNMICGDALDVVMEHAGSAVLTRAVVYPSVEEDLLILEVDGSLHTAKTYGEIYGMRFNYDMASASSADTLLQVFVLPIEQCFAPNGLQFSNPAELNDAKLMQFVRAMLFARDAAGERAIEIETRENGWSYSAQRLRQMLDQYLSGHNFSLDEGVFMLAPYESIGEVYPVVREIEFFAESKKMVLQVDAFAEQTQETLLRQSTYTIQFTGDGYRYLSILDRRMDQSASEGISTPANPAD